MSYESRAYDNKYGNPVVVLVATGTHDVSRLVNLLAGNRMALCEHIGLSERILRQVKRHNGGREALKLLAEHGGPNLADEADSNRPRIVVLCGSTRFRDEFAAANRELTLQGAIVVAPGVFGHSGDPMTDEDKLRLDDLHQRKIDLADEVFIVNVGGYIGESTRAEIAYAEKLGKPITYLEPPTR